MSIERLFASGVINILGGSPIIQLNYESGGGYHQICPEGSPSLVISLEGVTVIFMICPEGYVRNTMICPEGYVRNTISVLGGSSKTLLNGVYTTCTHV